MLLAAALATAAAFGGADVPPGESVEGRPLSVERRGDPDAPRRVLVVGSIHGDEPGGKRVAAAALRARPPRGVQVWVVRDLNPDGARRGTRQNARGVDLNRNFPHRWRPGRRGRYWPGRRAASEPETRWAMRLVRAVRPQVTVWLHQPYRFVVPAQGADRRLVRRYARAAGLPVRRLPRYRGTAAGWQNALLPGGGAFVVELAAGAPSRATVRRHVRAVWAAARGVAVARAGAAQAAERPPIHWDAIPYGRKRKRQMRRYARRHYGLRTHLLREPKTVVLHYTAGDTYASARDHFAANRPDLGELPGTCAHFAIDKRGRIHQLVPLRLMCRHVVGLNHVAIGIEHVGRSDAEVMGNERQLDASLRLTRWLQDRHAIPTRHVIGHAESLSSPFHRERVKAWRTLTHGDFRRATMRRYRRMLASSGA
ncbi:MAG TPA: N-acetylmuramoyl-L-alanine amidase [Solirubrobacteraceae bacterium]|nr:N-acetylmuramoyl-L-alanine amidase [Solirubrobacteraceae bacterium]